MRSRAPYPRLGWVRPASESKFRILFISYGTGIGLHTVGLPVHEEHTYIHNVLIGGIKYYLKYAMNFLAS